MRQEMQSPTHDLRWRWLAALLTGAAVFNALAYTAKFANPVIASDYWYFLDAFVREVRGGTLDILDFFVKRGGSDHAQPLKKLVLLANVQLADLDLAFDALVGFGFAFACVAVLERLLRDDLPARRADAFYAFSAAALAASLLTLNAGMIFNYSLIALEFSTYLVVVMTFLAAWRAMNEGAWWSYIASLVLLSLVADDTALLTTAAVALCCVLFAAKAGRWRAPMLAAGAAIGLHLLYLLTFAELIPQRGSMPQLPATAGSNPIALLFAQDQWLALFTIPLASSLAHLDQLKYWVPNHIVAATWSLAGLTTVLHALFWYRALRGRMDRSTFVATAMMLLLYAYVAGIIYVRVSVQGAGYLNSPRYVFFYLLSNVALVLMSAAEYRRPMHDDGRGKMIAMFVVGLVLVLQVPLSAYSWWQGRYLVKYQQTMVQQVLHLDAVPENASVACVPILLVCNYPPQRRVETVHYLEQQHLNVFSEQFRRDHAALARPQP